MKKVLLSLAFSAITLAGFSMDAVKTENVTNTPIQISNETTAPAGKLRGEDCFPVQSNTSCG